MGTIRRLPVLVASAAIVFFLSRSPSVEACCGVQVTVNPIPAPTIDPFPPDMPPTDPPIAPGESGDTQESISVLPGDFTFATTKVTHNPDGSITVSIKLQGNLPVTVSGTDTIRIPQPANPPTAPDNQLLDHEKGHAQLDRNEFDRDAKLKTEQIFNGVNEIDFKGTGATVADATTAAKTAMENYIEQRAGIVQAAIRIQSQVLSDSYDDLTDHGLNDKGPIDSSQKGVDAALKSRDQASGAGSNSNSPDPQKPHASTAPDPATVSYDALSGAFDFGGALTLQFGADGLDPILGRGVVEVDPMLLIGLQDNGTYHLADTEMSIVDEQSGDPLLKAYLLQIAYMPSSLPGFAGMIEGSLEILPAFTGDVNNFIGSSLLSGLQSSADAGEPTEFWFYVNDPLFDSNGNLLAGPDPIDGSLKIGVGTPEPSSILLFLSMTAILVYIRRAKRKRMAE